MDPDADVSGPQRTRGPMPPDTQELLDVPTSALKDPLLRENAQLLAISRGFTPLGRDHRGDAVSRIQGALARLGYEVRATAGVFDRALSAVVQRFQRRYGLRVTGLVDARTLLALDAALQRRGAPVEAPDALVRLDHRHPEYLRAAAAWPDDQPIWPRLTTSAAQLEFIHHCLAHDETDRLPYQGGFPNLCTGFASQVYARFSARASLSDAARAHLRGAPRIDGRRVPVKLRLPMFLVSSRGHMFNAVHVGGEPDRISSYLFIEPQRDEIIARGGAFWRQHIERHGISLADLVDCDPDGRLDTRHVQGFLLSGSGEMLPVGSERATQFGKDLALADSDPREYRFMLEYEGKAAKKPVSFPEFVAIRAHRRWCLSRGEIVEVGRLVLGRRLREHPDAVATPVTPTRYAAWLGQPELAAELR